MRAFRGGAQSRVNQRPSPGRCEHAFGGRFCRVRAAPAAFDHPGRRERRPRTRPRSYGSGARCPGPRERGTGSSQPVTVTSRPRERPPSSLVLPPVASIGYANLCEGKQSQSGKAQLLPPEAVCAGADHRPAADGSEGLECQRLSVMDCRPTPLSARIPSRGGMAQPSHQPPLLPCGPDSRVSCSRLGDGAHNFKRGGFHGRILGVREADSEFVFFTFGAGDVGWNGEGVKCRT